MKVLFLKAPRKAFINQICIIIGHYDGQKQMEPHKHVLFNVIIITCWTEKKLWTFHHLFTIRSFVLWEHFQRYLNVVSFWSPNFLIPIITRININEY